MASAKILIVDDEPDILTLLEKKLVQEGYDVVKATSGNEALEKARNMLPDLILMDVVLPDINGAEVVSILKKDARTRGIPAVFLTGMITRHEEEDVHLGVEVDGCSYPTIAKPIDDEQFFREIRKILEKN